MCPCSDAYGQRLAQQVRVRAFNAHDNDDMRIQCLVQGVERYSGRSRDESYQANAKAIRKGLLAQKRKTTNHNLPNRSLQGWM